MKSITLKNGLNVYLVPVEGTKAVTVLVMAKVGSRNETKELNGASHFIEHMMFKGTEKLPTPADVARGLDAIGADYNAYTSKEYTGYYIKCDASHQKFALDTLYDMTFNSKYQEEEMDRERRVIIEEINMYEDTPVRHIEDLLERVMFEGNSLGWEIAGSPDTMRTMTREDVMKFRDDYYKPERMAIAVAGDVNESTEDWLNATFGTVETNEAPNGFEDFGDFPVYEVPPVAMQKKVTEQVHLGLGFPGIAYNDPRLPVMKVLSTLLGGNMSSRLFMSVREKGGLAYRINCGHSAYEDTGIVAILAGLDKSRLDEALKRIFDEVNDVIENGPTDEEMARTKSYIKGHILLSMENSSSRASWYAMRSLFYDEILSPDEQIKRLEAVTKDQVQELAREVFDRSKMTMSYIGSEESAENVRAALPWKTE